MSLKKGRQKKLALIAVWFLGTAISIGGESIELYRAAWLRDWSLPTVTLLLFWLFAARKAIKYLRSEWNRRDFQ